ncbi:glycosyltransferase family 2 protein [Bacteroides oleiciplenus]|uniref:Glycosyltransferase 2-like domain-containing protein n=1 Tax=Bacteroides oleiciplenus YIT 12058 TaxID=742727 RepID=K9E5N5_9BACE|nr:glycosyltransferase family 2 protein [Bacteroides oleiciplenus]EKU91883.1 hypothetical protein HMPREF9447_00869 [Bacteroides oleiciplenus YIT 12058]
MHNKIVSIVIPNFNNTQYLKEIVDCIKRQTFLDWELIVVDDVSTDNSYEFALELAISDSRITVLQRDRLPKGGQTCRNIGLKNAKGKYVIFLDSDDLISDNCLKQRVEFMQNNLDIDFGIFKAHSFKPREDYQTLYRRDITWGNKRVDDPIDAFLRNEYPYLVVTNIYVRQSLSGICWDEELNVRQDLDFNLTTLWAGLKYKFAENSDYDYFYRGVFSSNNVSGNMTSPEKFKGMVYLFDKIISHLNLNQETSKYMIPFRRYVIHYFNSLIISGTSKHSDFFLNHYRPFFSKWFILRMLFVKKVVDLFSDNSVKTFISSLLLLLLFGYRYYFNLIGKLFNRILSITV